MAACSENGVLLIENLRRLELVFADQIRDGVVQFLLSCSDKLHAKAVSLPTFLHRGIGQSYSSIQNRIQRISEVNEYAGLF